MVALVEKTVEDTKDKGEMTKMSSVKKTPNLLGQNLENKNGTTKVVEVVIPTGILKLPKMVIKTHKKVVGELMVARSQVKMKDLVTPMVVAGATMPRKIANLKMMEVAGEQTE